MENKSLEELISNNIDDLKKGKISDRIKSFTNYDSKYIFVKSSVMVRVKIKELGIDAEIDVTDFFKDQVK